MEKGKIIELQIDDMSNQGKGIGKFEGMAVFVDGAVYGDTVRAEVTKVKKRYAFARTVEIVEASEFRQEPYCQYMGQCGGCSLGLLNYDGQLELKYKQVYDKLERIGEVENPKVQPIIGMDDPWRYRNKASMAVWTGGIITRKGGIVENLDKPSVGFYKGKSHSVVDCEDCYLQAMPALAAAYALRQFMIEDNITAYDPKWDKGLMKNIIVKTAFNTGQVMVILVINGKGIPNHNKLVEMINDEIYNLPPTEDGVYFNLESVVMNINKGKNASLLTDECLTIAGKNVIREELNGLVYEISPLAFYQVNPVQTEKLYDKAMEYADLKGGETVLDLYCGVGTIGLNAISRGAGKVIGIESVKGAVIDANRNAVINGIVNARYICGKAEEVLPAMMAGEYEDDYFRIDRPEVVILDPPRAGCDERLLEAVCEAKAERIVYVSCDPSTLARDVKYLREHGYEFVEATPVDMFPHTQHVECVVLMSRV